MVKCNCVDCNNEGKLFGVMFKNNPKTNKKDNIPVHYCGYHAETIGRRLITIQEKNTNIRILTESEKEHAKTIHFQNGVLVRNGVAL